MRMVTRSLVDTCLLMLNRIPGSRVLLLLPAAALYSKAGPPQFYSVAKADSVASSTPHAAGQVSSGAAADGALNGGLAALVSKLLGPNEFASGGLTLMLLGAAAAAARVAVSSGLRYWRRHVMVTAEIDSRDDAYRWVMHWLSEHPKFKNSTMVSVTTNLSCFGTAVSQQPLAAGSTGTAGAGPPVSYLPAPGDHLLRYQGRWMCISRRRAGGNPQLAANARLLLETLSISMLGVSRGPLESLLSEAAAAYHHSQSCRTAVHSVDQDGYWTQVGSRPIRPLNTVVLPKGQAGALLCDCREFLASEAWYAHHGIPYRRGYLLFGPPGTGKTSLVMALAGALGLEIYVVTLSSPTMTDETLRNLMNSAGVRSILLLEDVDAAFVDRTAGGGGAARLTFSGLLNAIDGVAAQEGRLLFMTTNHIDRLSDALIRPGRVDVRCHLGPASLEQAKDLFVSFYRDLPHLMLQPHSLLSKETTAAAAAAGIAVPDFLSAAEEVTPVEGEAGAGSEGDSAAATAAGSEKTATAAAAAAGKGARPQLAHQQPQQLSSPMWSASLAAAGEAVAAAAAEREQVLAGLAAQFAQQLPAAGGVSMAQLQGYLMTHRKDPWAAVANVGQLLQQTQQPDS